MGFRLGVEVRRREPKLKFFVQGARFEQDVRCFLPFVGTRRSVKELGDDRCSRVWWGMDQSRESVYRSSRIEIRQRVVIK